MNFSLRKTLTLALISSLALSACKSLGSPEEQKQADGLWSQMANYESWGHFEGSPSIQPGASPHGKFVRIFINSVAEGSQANPAYGSIIVKENFGKNDVGSLSAITVMQRIEGFDPDNNDWFYARYSKDGTQTHSGKPAMCIDCHFDAEDDDYIFLND